MLRAASPYMKRALAGVVAEAAAPVVILQGAAGVGKTFLVQNDEAFRAFHYVTLADDDVYAEAAADPIAWAATLPRPTVIDEAERVEGLLNAVRQAAPQMPAAQPAFVLVASRELPDEASEGPLLQRFTLFPLTQAELHERRGCVVDDLFERDAVLGFRCRDPRSDLRAKMRIGGFPHSVLHPARTLSRNGAQERPFREYLSLVEDEGIGLGASPEHLIEQGILRKVLANPGISLGQSALAQSCHIDIPTLRAYLEELRVRFFVHRLFALDTPERRRHCFAQTRVHPVDVSVACEAMAAVGSDMASDPATFSKAFKTFCVGQLMAAAQWATVPTTCWHWRKFYRRMREADLVLEREGRLVGITVRNSLAASPQSIGALRLLAEDDRFHRGFIIYMGRSVRKLTDNIWALPASALWEEGAFFPAVPGD